MADLERIQTPEDRELDAKRVELVELKTVLVERELDLSTLQQELASFEAEYLRVVGSRYATLDELKAKIAEAEAAHRPADEQARADAEATRDAADTSAEHVSADLDEGTSTSFSPPPSLKALYRTIARRLHPDLAATDAERERRHEWMAKVNAAYKQGNEASLHKLQDQWNASPEAIEGYDVGSELIRAIRQIARLQDRITHIEQQIETLRGGQLYTLKTKCETAQEQGRDKLEELATFINTQISKAEDTLAGLEESPHVAGTVAESENDSRQGEGETKHVVVGTTAPSSPPEEQAAAGKTADSELTFVEHLKATYGTDDGPVGSLVQELTTESRAATAYAKTETKEALCSAAGEELALHAVSITMTLGLPRRGSAVLRIMRHVAAPSWKRYWQIHDDAFCLSAFLDLCVVRSVFKEEDRWPELSGLLPEVFKWAVGFRVTAIKMAPEETELFYRKAATHQMDFEENAGRTHEQQMDRLMNLHGLRRDRVDKAGLIERAITERSWVDPWALISHYDRVLARR